MKGKSNWMFEVAMFVFVTTVIFVKFFVFLLVAPIGLAMKYLESKGVI